MPETPDFEQIARRLSGVWADRGAVEGMTESVAEQLRLVWNARGAADIDTVNCSLLTGNVPKVVDALRSLDR